MSRILRTAALVILPVLTVALGFQLGSSYERQRMSLEQDRLSELFSGSTGSGVVVQSDPQEEVDLTLMWSVWRLLSKHYIDPPALQVNKMVFGAVSGLVSAVGDPYTVFMDPADSRSFQDAMHGTLEGIGAQLDIKNGQVTVVSPLKGSPAERAGIQPDDVILEVDGTETTGLPLENVVTKIRGPKGTSVVLIIGRKGQRQHLTITVVRDSVHIPSVESKTLKTASGTIGVVALNQFGAESIPEMRKALQALPKDMKGLVLDLRYNGGGYLEGAVDLVSMFSKEGKVVTVERRDSEPEEHFVSGEPILSAVPLAVIVNGGSASAAEIAAGALRDHKRAILVGTKSFGKGTVQEVLELPGGASLRVTTARWLTPSGHNLAKSGITPDLVVDRTLEQFRAGKDPQLDTAVEWLTDKQDISKSFGTSSAASAN